MQIYTFMMATMGLALAPISAIAQNHAGPIPDLMGIWECDPSPTLFRDGEWTEVARKLEVTEQRDALFTATNHWELPIEDGVEGHQRGKRSISGAITWIGVIGFDNKSFVAVSQGDGHHVWGELTDPNTLQFMSVEAGDNAWTNRDLCRRESS